MFQDLMHDIQSTFTERFFKIQVSAERPEPPRAQPPRSEPPRPIGGAPVGATPLAGPAGSPAHQAAPTSGADDLFMGPPPRVAPPRPQAKGPGPAVTSSLGPVGRTTTAVPEVGRNDPCPCGSGKKYKKCHGVGR
jgi:preprotein translocase subunit SecA